MGKQICVVGGGVSGLSSAIRLAESGQHKVHLIARGTGRETTSSVAAAFWYPFWTGATPNHKWYKPDWAKRTYEVFESLMSEPATGISQVKIYEYFSEHMKDKEINEVIDSMWWAKLPHVGFKRLGKADVAAKSFQLEVPEGSAIQWSFKAGISFSTFVVNMADYLQYLQTWNNNLGVSFEQATVSDLTDLARRFDFVINCTGLGSRTLVPDDETVSGRPRLRPVEGVVVSVPPMPNIKDILLIHTGRYFQFNPLYVVPRSGSKPDIILGGSLTQERLLVEAERKALQPQHLRLNTLPSNHWLRVDAERIIRDCRAFEPSLPSSGDFEVKVGYRPNRNPKVRLKKDGNIIHNYGHGGGGITFSWGCAEEVKSWVSK